MSRYKTKDSSPAEKIKQLIYNDTAKAEKNLDVLPAPFLVIADASAAGVYVGKGNLLRIEGTAGGYVRFGADPTMTAPIITSQDALKTAAVFFFTIATDEFVRTSAAMRIEVTED